MSEFEVSEDGFKYVSQDVPGMRMEARSPVFRKFSKETITTFANQMAGFYTLIHTIFENVDLIRQAGKDPFEILDDLSSVLRVFNASVAGLIEKGKTRMN